MNQTITSTVSRKLSYADVAKDGFKNATENSTPNFSRQARTARHAKPARTPKSTNPIIAGTSTNKIGRPVSPSPPPRPKPEKAVWISGIHRDATEEELTNYIQDSVGIASADVDVRKLVKKGRDLTEYRFVSFRIGCSSINFNKLMNPMYWPSNSRIREFDLEGVRFNKMSHQVEFKNASNQAKNLEVISTAPMEE